LAPSRNAGSSLAFFGYGTANCGKKVLVVDDEVFVRMLVADVLDEAGFDVIEASDAQTGSQMP
jgi:PleD family two-component response regulator